MAIQRVTKIDAARRQLETAIRLFFEGGDPVSIHALALASHELLADLNRTGGGQKMLAERRVLPGLDPKHAKKVVIRALAHRNFFKHADRDPHAVIDHEPSDVEGFLYDACAKHHDLAGEWAPTLKAYVCWCMAAKPHLFSWTPAMGELSKSLSTALGQTNLRGFFTSVSSQIASGII